MINTNFKIGDLVTNPRFCKYDHFKLEIKHLKGVTAKNQEWFDNLKSCKNEKFTLEKLIEEIKTRRNKTEKDLPSLASDYWTGYSDALGELLEYIEDNK